jgi:acyl carrier protein
MDETRQRLAKCFRTVFPNLRTPETATQDGMTEWDSIAAITLINVIDEEFNIQIDYDEVAELTSFDRILEYLNSVQKAS